MSAPSTSSTPSLATGSYVQYNAATQSPLAPGPSAAEQTLGIIRQFFTAQGQQYAQVVWNPGSQFPNTGLYTTDQLCGITQQQAADITNQMNAGTYQPSTTTPGSDYQQPAIPTLALPPGNQGEGITPTATGPINQPLSPGTGYQ
jgi:hypothetical protein